MFKLGKAVKWFLDNVEGTNGNAAVQDAVENPGSNVLDGEVVIDDKIYVGDEVIPNVCEKPIKFVGRWIREDAKDTVVTGEVQQDLVVYLERLDKSELSGLQKCWGYQFMVLSKMKWPLAVYDTPLTTVIF